MGPTKSSLTSDSNCESNNESSAAKKSSSFSEISKVVANVWSRFKVPGFSERHGEISSLKVLIKKKSFEIGARSLLELMLQSYAANSNEKGHLCYISYVT